jgi:hypothetical protein
LPSGSELIAQPFNFALQGIHPVRQIEDDGHVREVGPKIAAQAFDRAQAHNARNAGGPLRAGAFRFEQSVFNEAFNQPRVNAGADCKRVERQLFAFNPAERDLAKPAPPRAPRLPPNRLSKKSLNPPAPRPPILPKISPKSPYSTRTFSHPGGGVKSEPAFQFAPS